MSLSVTCPDCDKTLKVKDELAGKRIRCPGCSAVISIPADSGDEDFLSGFEQESPRRKRRSDDDESDEAESPARPRVRRSAKKKSGRKQSSGINLAAIGGLVGGAATVLTVIVVLAGVINRVQPGKDKVLANWISFKHPLGVAQVDMPAQPSFNAGQSLNGAQTYSLMQRTCSMSLTAVKFDGMIQAGMANPATVELMLNEIQNGVTRAGATLISSRRLTVGPYPGQELKVNLKGNINLMRFYVTPGALIGAEFISRNEATYAAEREKFFNSLRGPDGNVIDGPAQPPPQAPGQAGPPAAGAHAGPGAATVSPGVKPTPPLQLAPPPDAAPILNGQNLSNGDPRTLGAAAHQAANQDQDFARAAQLQFWYVKKANEGHYNLACYLSRAGQREAALYWLQVAALEEGVDSAWATQDPDMQPLRSDPRWNEVLPFLQRCNAYWSTVSQTETQLIMPAGVGPAEPIPVMIGLHGMGSSAAGFVDAETYQSIANAKRVAFLGVSGTVPRGPRSFVWSEDPARDAARVDAALNEVKSRLTPKEGQLVLFGFSQGGMMSAEIAVRHPDRYAGALVMSPGGNRQPQPADFHRTPNSRAQNAICVCGAGEHPGNVELTQTYANLFRQAGARVDHKPYPGHEDHSLPPDYLDQLPTWIDFLLGVL